MSNYSYFIVNKNSFSVQRIISANAEFLDLRNIQPVIILPFVFLNPISRRRSITDIAGHKIKSSAWRNINILCSVCFEIFLNVTLSTVKCINRSYKIRGFKAACFYHIEISSAYFSFCQISQFISLGNYRECAYMTRS